MSKGEKERRRWEIKRINAKRSLEDAISHRLSMVSIIGGSTIATVMIVLSYIYWNTGIH